MITIASIPRVVSATRGGRAGPRVRGPRCCTSHWEARGFQALQWRAPESEQGRAVPRRGAFVVGCQPWLIWRLYVYYDTRGRNTSSSLLANRSEKSAKPSRPRGASHQVQRESRVPTRKILFFFFSFFFLCKQNTFHRATSIEFICVRDAWKSRSARIDRASSTSWSANGHLYWSPRSRMIVLAWCLFVIVSFLVAKNQAFLNAPIPGTF